MTDEERQRLYFDLIFHSYAERDWKSALRYVAGYLQYLSNCIDYKRKHVSAPIELLQRFESALMILKDITSRYPNPIPSQLSAITENLALERLFATIAIEQSEVHPNSDNLIEAIFRGFQSAFAAKDKDPANISNLSLKNAKIALVRLAQLASYAETLDTPDFDDGAADLSDHFNPELVDKPKILALLNALVSQASKISDTSIRGRLLTTLSKLDEEVRRKKPRWKMALGTLFFLLGFLADLKTLEPSVYEPLYRTASAIVTAIHEESMVEYHRRRPELPAHQEAPALPPSSESFGGFRSDDEDED